MAQERRLLCEAARYIHAASDADAYDLGVTVCTGVGAYDILDDELLNALDAIERKHDHRGLSHQLGTTAHRDRRYLDEIHVRFYALIKMGKAHAQIAGTFFPGE